MEARPLSSAATSANSATLVPSPGICVLGPKSTTAFVVTIEWLAGGVPVVSVIGDLDLTTASTLEETLLTLPDHGAEAVIVDLSCCSSIDLRGLHVLLVAQERLDCSHQPLVLVCGDPKLRRVFKTTRVDPLFQIYPSLTAAANRVHVG